MTILWWWTLLWFPDESLTHSLICVVLMLPRHDGREGYSDWLKDGGGPFADEEKSKSRETCLIQKHWIILGFSLMLSVSLSLTFRCFHSLLCISLMVVLSLISLLTFAFAFCMILTICFMILLLLHFLIPLWMEKAMKIRDNLLSLSFVDIILISSPSSSEFIHDKKQSNNRIPWNDFSEFSAQQFWFNVTT